MTFFDVLGWFSFNFFDVKGFYDATIKLPKIVLYNCQFLNTLVIRIKSSMNDKDILCL